MAKFIPSYFIRILIIRQKRVFLVSRSSFDSLSLEIQNAPSFVSCGTNVRTLSIRSQGPNLFHHFALKISLVILVTGQVARESSRPKSCRPKPARNFSNVARKKKVKSPEEKNTKKIRISDCK